MPAVERLRRAVPTDLPLAARALVTGRRWPRGAGGQQLRSGAIPRSLREATSLPQRRILIIHVPKTGGTSLRHMLADHVPAEQRFLSTGAHEWVGRSIAELRGFTLFSGHSYLEPLYLFPQDDWVTVLPVRDPVDWWRSYYTYTGEQMRSRGRLDEPVVRLPMGEWVDTARDANLSNGQTSWLLGRARVMFDSVVADGRTSDVGMSLRARPRAVLRLLDQLLARVTVVGVTTDLQPMYAQVCRAMGWTPVHERPMHSNVSAHLPDRVLLTPAQEARIRGLNRIDQYLYDRARGRPRAGEHPRRRGRYAPGGHPAAG